MEGSEKMGDTGNAKSNNSIIDIFDKISLLACKQLDQIIVEV